MGFKCGIVGLPNVGKSTLFNALTTSKKAQAENFPFCTIDPNIGIVAVPDERLNKISAITKSAKTINAAITFVDIAGLVKGASKGEGLGNKFLSHVREVDAINHRLDMVEFFFINRSVLNQLKDHLKKVPDIERALSRLSLGRGGPRDLAVIREGLIASKSIGACLIGLKLPKGLQGLLNDFGSHDKLVSILSDALESDLPVYVRDGGFIAKGFSKEFDQLRELRDDRRYLISQLQVKYVQTSGVQGLKIKYNKLKGYQNIHSLK